MTVIVVAAAAVPESTLTVARDVALPPADGVTLGDENPTWTPAGRELVLSATAELNEPNDVIVTVSVAEPPAPTLRVGELSDNEKSALEVIVRAKEAECVPNGPAPVIVMILVPTAALGSTVTVRLAEALPPDEIEMGFGLKAEKLTPAGTGPVTESATGPAKLSSEVPVIVTMLELPCAIEIVGVAVSVKSGAVGVSSATLFDPASKTQTFPEESTTTSCGCVWLPIDHSVNCPFGAPTLGALAGATTFVETAVGGRTAAVTPTGPPPEAEVAGAAPTTDPPADWSSSAILPFPAFTEFSAIQGC